MVTGYRHKVTFIELAFLAGHFTGGAALPPSLNLRSAGSAIVAAFAAYCKLAGVLVYDAPLRWTVAFLKRKVRSAHNVGALASVGLMTGPINGNWKSAQDRANRDVMQSLVHSTSLLTLVPKQPQKLCNWQASPEQAVLAWLAQRIGDIQRSEVKIRITSRPQRKLRRVPFLRAKITGPCFFGCLFTTKRRVGGIPIWSRIPEACATTSVPAGAVVCNRCYNSEVRAARNQARCRRWPERQDADYGVEGDIESRSNIRRKLLLGTSVPVLRVIAARAMVRHTTKTRKAQLVGDILEAEGLQRHGGENNGDADIYYGGGADPNTMTVKELRLQ